MFWGGAARSKSVSAVIRVSYISRSITSGSCSQDGGWLEDCSAPGPVEGRTRALEQGEAKTCCSCSSAVWFCLSATFLRTIKVVRAVVSDRAPAGPRPNITTPPTEPRPQQTPVPQVGLTLTSFNLILFTCWSDQLKQKVYSSNKKWKASVDPMSRCWDQQKVTEATVWSP